MRRLELDTDVPREITIAEYMDLGQTFGLTVMWDEERGPRQSAGKGARRWTVAVVLLLIILGLKVIA